MLPTEDVNQIAEMVPTFWTSVFSDSATVSAVLTGVATTGEVTDGRLARVVNDIAPATADAYDRYIWFPITLDSSQRQSAGIVYYGGGAVFGPQPTTGQVYQFGTPANSSVSYPVPTNFLNAAIIVDKLALPTASWTPNCDCLILNNQIIFANDPLNGVIGKTTLFVADAQFLSPATATRFGVIARAPLDKLPAGVLAAQALLNGLAAGTTEYTLRQYIAAVTGLPCATSTETVIDIFANSYTLKVITDKNVYTYPAKTTPVAIGTVLQIGDWGIQGVGFYRASNLPSTVTDVPLPPQFTGLPGLIYIPNRQVPVTTTVNGSHLVSTWPMNGDAASVTQFFATAQTVGMALGKTLGDSMNRRSDGLAVLGAVPNSINPFAVATGQGVFENYLFVTLPTAAADGPTLQTALINAVQTLPPGCAPIVIQTA